MESHAIHFSTDSSGKVDEVILWPRSTKDFKRLGGYVIRCNTNPDDEEIKKITSLEFEKLPVLLAQRRSEHHE